MGVSPSYLCQKCCCLLHLCNKAHLFPQGLPVFYCKFFVNPCQGLQFRSLRLHIPFYHLSSPFLAACTLLIVTLRFDEQRKVLLYYHATIICDVIIRSRSFHELPSLHVNFISLAIPTPHAYTNEFAPTLRIAAKILSTKYLHREIR